MLSQQKSEVNIILALNKALQKSGEKTQFYRFRYLPSGVVSTVFTENANIGLIVPWLSNLFI